MLQKSGVFYHFLNVFYKVTCKIGNNPYHIVIDGTIHNMSTLNHIILCGMGLTPRKVTMGLQPYLTFLHILT